MMLFKKTSVQQPQTTPPSDGGVKTLQKRSRMALQTRRNLVGYWFVLPFIVGMLVVYIPSLIEAFRFSVSEIVPANGSYTLNPVGWSFYKYILFVDADFLRNIVESIGSMFLNVLIILIYSLLIATILNRNIKGKGFYRAMLFLPVVIATGIIAKADNFTLASSGSAALTQESGAVAGGLFSEVDLTTFLSSLGLATGFTNIVVSAANNIYSIVTSSGVQLIIFLAGLQSISPSVYESATVEGATWWESFWKITIPMISPLILVNMVYTVVDCFTRYDNSVMEDVFTRISNGAYSDAAARAFCYLIFVAVILAIVGFITSKFVFYEDK